MKGVFCSRRSQYTHSESGWENIGCLAWEVLIAKFSKRSKTGDLALWQEENRKLAATRRKVLGELQQKLNSPQPPENKISQYRLYKCDWKLGDVFAYQFNSEYAKENDFYRKYVYFVKVDETIWYPGHIVPVVYFYKKVGDALADIASLSHIDFIPQFYRPIAHENYPGMKKQYLLTLLNTSSRVIPKNQRTCLGNMGHVN